MPIPLIPAITAGATVLQTGAGLANMFYGNRFARREARRQRERDEKREQEMMGEYKAEKDRQLDAQKLADLFANAGWMTDKNKERLEQNYGYYVQNGRR